MCSDLLAKKIYERNYGNWRSKIKKITRVNQNSYLTSFDNCFFMLNRANPEMPITMT
jgi:hypothetical protein